MKPTRNDSHDVAGLVPALPWPLSRFDSWTTLVRAELLALLRIGLAIALLLDIFGTILPDADRLFGGGSYGEPSLFAWMFENPRMHWSLLEGVSDHAAIRLALWVWATATLCLLVGWNTRVSAVLVWVLSVSFTNLNLYAINAGDHIRGMLLLYLMLVPCGAVWSVDARQRRRLVGSAPREVRVHPWALRLMLLQLALMYCASGICKMTGEDWTSGSSLYYVMRDTSLTRISADQFALPYIVTRLMTWTVLAWEVAFPLLIAVRRTRGIALWMGAAFHLGIFVTLEIGCFPLYLLALYVPLLAEHHSRGAEPEVLSAPVEVAHESTIGSKSRHHPLAV